MSATDETEILEEEFTSHPVGQDGRGSPYLDSQFIADELETRGIAVAQAKRSLSILTKTQSILLAKLARDIKKSGGVKTITEAKLIAMESEEWSLHEDGRIEAEYEYECAKYRYVSFDAWWQAERTNASMHRALAQIR